MKFRMILAALLLPAVVPAQQPGEKPQTTPSPYTNSFQYIPATNGNVVPLDYFVTTPEQSKEHVNLNLRNAPLKEAIKQLTEQTKQEFVLEADAPAGARVTIVAKNIRLNTALDMLTDATNLNWNRQTVKKTDAKEAVVVYHLGKKVSRNWWEQGYFSPYINTAVPRDSNGNLYWNGQNYNRWNFQYTAPKTDPGQKPELTPAPKGNRNFDVGTNLLQASPYTNSLRVGTTFTQGQSNNFSATYSPLATTLTGVFNTTEVRSTFTCPHCKNQVTVIHKHEAPKCDKCGRVFHDDWQFCPFDGAKRPAGTDTDWQFCPICGERIKPDGKVETKPKGGKADPNSAKGM